MLVILFCAILNKIDFKDGRGFILTNLITIHPGMNKYSYGFETSQLSRFKVAQYLGWGYLHVLTSPQLQDGYWKDTYVKFGFLSDSLISIPNCFSDCGHDSLSVTPSDLDSIFKDGEIFTQGAYVTHVKVSGSTWFFTSKPYLEMTSEDVLIWYNRDGSVSMKAKYFDIDKEPTPVDIFSSDYLYYKDDEWLTSEDLLIRYLLATVRSNDLLIRDQHQVPHLKLWRFVDFRSLNYYEYVHHNVLIDPCANLRKRTRYLVASERLADDLEKQGYQVTFCPPIFVGMDKGSSFNLVQNEPKEFCFVGNMSDNKRVDWVISVFKDLYKDYPDLRLNLYGNLDDLERYDLTDNITYHGFVSQVPYEDNQVYISCSKTELFANACVEALSQGLVALLSDVDFAHRFYNEMISNVALFQTKEELRNLVISFSKQVIETKDGIDFVSNNYGLEVVSSLYNRLLER